MARIEHGLGLEGKQVVGGVYFGVDDTLDLPKEIGGAHEAIAK